MPPLLDRVRDLSADAGTTVKTLWRLYDGSLVESVLMRYGVPGLRASGKGRERATVCISSQAGCGMACPFCATGQGGLQRNLSTAEILAQVIDAARRLRDGEVPGGPGRINNIVFMGMGEPMANYTAVLRAVRGIVGPAPDGLGISARGVTVSTVGLVPQIQRLTEEGLPVTLAVSLHAPDDELRDTLCPINTRWPVAEVVGAAHRYFEKTGRRVSIEYALIRDINDQGWRADALANLLHPVRLGLGAREPDSAEPDARVEVDGLASRGRAGVRPPARGQGSADHRPRHPGTRDRRCLRSAGSDRGGPHPRVVIHFGCAAELGQFGCEEGGVGDLLASVGCEVDPLEPLCDAVGGPRTCQPAP